MIVAQLRKKDHTAEKDADSCVSATQSRFERWGVNSLLVARFVPGLGIIAPPLAGALGIGWLRFGALSGASAVGCGHPASFGRA